MLLASQTPPWSPITDRRPSPRTAPGRRSPRCTDADIVCARAKNHYDPSGSQADLSESATRLDSTDAQRQLEAFKANFKPLNDRTRRVMDFS